MAKFVVTDISCGRFWQLYIYYSYQYQNYIVLTEIKKCHEINFVHIVQRYVSTMMDCVWHFAC